MHRRVLTFVGVALLSAAALPSAAADEPISVPYRDVRVWECPPNGQGLAALLALAMVDGCELPPAGSAGRTHLQVEALRLGFADARWYVTYRTL